MGHNEPINGDFWLMKSKNIELCNEIIQNCQQKARELGYPYFNPIEGWGYAIIPADL